MSNEMSPAARRPGTTVMAVLLAAVGRPPLMDARVVRAELDVRFHG